jgi:hypothetical protein
MKDGVESPGSFPPGPPPFRSPELDCSKTISMQYFPSISSDDRRLPAKGALFLFVLLLLGSCQQDPQAQWQALDLLPYDIPLSVQAPDSAQVSSGELGPYRDVTIRAGQSYVVQTLAGEAASKDLARLKSEQLEVVRDNAFFEQLLREDPDGFIYELKIDSISSYGFVQLFLQDGKEYILRSGLASTFSLEQAQRMYEAVRP